MSTNPASADLSSAIKLVGNSPSRLANHSTHQVTEQPQLPQKGTYRTMEAELAEAGSDGHLSKLTKTDQTDQPKMLAARSQGRSANQEASGSAVTQPYDIQMDQFQVIDSKGKQSFLVSPDNHGSSRMQSIPRTLTAKEEPAVTEQSRLAPSNKSIEQEVKRATASQQDVEPESNFFLTGVNVQNQDIEQYALMDKPAEESQPVSQRVDVDEYLAYEEQTAGLVDKYKMIAVVDAGRSFANNECVYVNMNKNEICHLSVDSHTSLQFDELISSYDQVFKIGRAMAHTFMTKRNSNKVVLNVADQFATNNNCGFNLANFKLKFLKNYYSEVVQDYERSFIGSFANSILKTFLGSAGEDSPYELYFTIAKFEGNMGYSLTQNYDEVKFDVDISQHELSSQQQFNQEHGKFQTLSEKPLSEGGAQPHLSADNNELNETTDILEAKGLQEDGSALVAQQQCSPQQQKVLNKQVAERRQEILKKGSIPEFVPIKDTNDFYRVYQEANYRNKLLIESQQQQQMENMMRGEPVDPSKALGTENSDLKNIKDDVVIMQFKLVKKENMKIINTQTFVNVPTSKISDINISTLMEIIQKQNSQNGTGKRSNRKDSQFLPYNKSILTRILYPCLNKSNFLVINHFSKKTILRHMKQQVSGYQTGPAKGLFSSLFKLGFDTLQRLTKKKLSQQTALKILQRTFKSELQGIFKEIDMFREGIKSLEVYTEQTANQLAKAGFMAGTQRSNPLTMFHQIMHFLVLQEEMTADAETFVSSTQNQPQNVNQTNPLRASNFFPSLLPEEEIQKVIFDQNYLEYISRKQMQNSETQPPASDIYQGGVTDLGTSDPSSGVNAQTAAFQAQDFASAGGINQRANASVQQAAAMYNQSALPQAKLQQAASEKEKKLQFVQYECIKSELKEEYDKKMGFLHKRLNKKAQLDPSFMLLNNLTTQPYSTKHAKTETAAFLQSGSGQFEQQKADRARQMGQQLQLQKKILSGPNQQRGSKSKTAYGGPPISMQERKKAQKMMDGDLDDDKKTKQQKKAEYYKFYLDNAQKAIDMMIQQHKSSSNLTRQGIRSGSNGRGAGSLSSNGPLTGDVQAQQTTFENIKRDLTNIQSAGSGIGNESYNGQAPYGGLGSMFDSNKNVNRSNSLHERKFNPASEYIRNQQRLEPLVQRHQKISRISVKQDGQSNTYAEAKPLEQIEESNKRFYNTRFTAAPKPHTQIGANQKRNKPFSANQNVKQNMRVIQETPGQAHPQAASTHYTSFKQASMPTAQNFINKQASGGTQGVISSNESYNQKVMGGTNGRAQTTNKDGARGEFTMESSQNHFNEAEKNNQMFNYSSDNNLHERRPGTSGNVLQQNKRLHMVMSEDATQQPAVYNLRQVQEDRQANASSNVRKPPNQYLATQNRVNSNHSKSINSGKRYSNQITQQPTDYSVASAGQPQNAKRLLSNAGARRCVRGELLTNGYKSLRAQGMLKAVHIEGSQSAQISQHGIPKQKSGFGRKGSKELEHVNICIEKTYTTHSQANETARKSMSDANDSARKRSVKNSSASPAKPSPVKFNQKILPQQLVPKKPIAYEPLKNSRQSNVSHNKNSSTEGVPVRQSMEDEVINEDIRASLNSRDTNNNLKKQHDPNDASSTLVNMKASYHIGESINDSDAIYVQDSAKLKAESTDPAQNQAKGNE